MIGVVWSSGTLPVTKLSLEFLVLTAARSGEVRLAAWEEMDPEARTWVISAGRMKAGREHRVPLQDRASFGHGACVPQAFVQRDWGAEQTDTPHAVMEAALVSCRSGYARSDLFVRRRRLIWWELYLPYETGVLLGSTGEGDGLRNVPRPAFFSAWLLVLASDGGLRHLGC